MPEPGLTAVSKAHLVPAGDFTGTVHSVFTTACNLAVGGLLVTVHDASARHTPASVRVSRDAGPWSPAARPGDAVRCDAGLLTFGGHALDLRRLPVWAPGPVPPPADPATVARLADEVAALRGRHLRMRALPAWDLDDRAGELSAALCGPANTRHGARAPYTAGTPDPLDHAVRRLIGLGAGLTPAGDDVLVGLLAALHRTPLPQAEHARRVIAHRVREDAHRTTDISAHYLRLAAAGEFGEPITGLVDALAGGATRAAVAARAQDVLRTGASSGADAVAGVLLGVRALVPPPVQKAA